MTVTEPGQAVLRHKLAAAREDAGGGRQGVRSALRALRLSLARAAEDVLDLRLSVIGATQWRGGPDGLEQRIGGNRLLLRLDGPQDAVGALTLDGGCVAAIVQQQTTGRVTGGDPAPRAFTATDAALCETLLDALLRQVPELADDPADRACLAGFRVGEWVEDAGSLMLALEASEYRLFELKLDFAGGAGQGALALVLPGPAQPPMDEDDPDDTADMVAALGLARASLTAVLCRMKLPFDVLGDLSHGDLLPLSGYRLDRTGLFGIDGRLVATGRLGQAGGMRALQLGALAPPPVDNQLPAPHGLAVGGNASDIPVQVPITEILPPDAAGGVTPDRPASSGDAPDEIPGETPAANAEAGDDPLAGLSHEEAVREISELAGLAAGSEPEPPPPALTGATE